MSFVNTFNSGTDQSITIINNQTGASVQLDGKRSMMKMSAEDELLKSEVIDNGGIPDHRVLANGWAGSIEVDKQSSNFASLFGFLEANYYEGGAQQYFTVMETIRSPLPNGPTERWMYVDVVFHKFQPGQWQKKQITKATVDVAAAQRVPA